MTGLCGSSPNATAIECGYCYQPAVVVPDGSTVVHPPGAPLPRAWIDDEDGHRRPVKDLVAPGRFLLIADIPLDAVRIGHIDGDYHDPGRPHRRAQPDHWAQTDCSGRAGRFLTGAGAAQR